MAYLDIAHVVLCRFNVEVSESHALSICRAEIYEALGFVKLGMVDVIQSAYWGPPSSYDCKHKQI